MFPARALLLEDAGNLRAPQAPPRSWAGDRPMSAIEDFLADAKRRMDRSIEATHHEFNSIAPAGLAALLDRIAIDYYGTPTP